MQYSRGRAEWDILPEHARKSRRLFSTMAVVGVVLFIGSLLSGTSSLAPTPVSVEATGPASMGVTDAARPVAAEYEGGGLALPRQGNASASAVAPSSATVAGAPVALPAAQSTVRRAPVEGRPPTTPDQPPAPGDIEQEWIVQLASGQPADEVASEHARQEGAEVHHVYGSAVDGYAAHMSDGSAADIAKDPRVVSVTRDRMVYATAQTVPTGVSRIGASPTSAANGVNADVAILDSGIDTAHSDLNVVGGKNCNGTGTSYTDGEGHGTHVAGTVGAKNDGNGVVGVAPGVRLWAVRVLNNSGSGSDANVICGLDFVRSLAGSANQIEVINLSLGGNGTAGSSCASSSLRQAVCNVVNAGTTVVVAAGNDAADARNHTPAAYPEVITVSALADFNGLSGGGGGATCRSDVDDTFANFSNYGPAVDIIAPGVCILSTARGGGTRTMSGTSMATPHVAGAAALYKASNPGATPTQVQQFLTSGGGLDWSNGDDRDSTKEPLLRVGSIPTTPPPSTTTTTTGSTTTTTTASTTTTQPTGSTTSTTTGQGSISLRVSKPWFSSNRNLSWTGAGGRSVDVLRRPNSGSTFTRLTTTTGTSYTDRPGSGTYVYKVCYAGTATCSNNVTSS